MSYESSKSVWYGKLKTSSSVSPVIFDPKLPHVPGRVYLFNADRKAIVQYVREKVDALLEEFTDAELKGIKQDIDAEWKKARKAFMAAQPKPAIPSKRQPSKTVVETQVDDDIDEGDLPADWDSDFDED